MRFKKRLGLALALLFAFTFSGCHYFKVAASLENGYEIEGALYKGKTIIVHTGNESWQLIYPTLQKDRDQLVAKYVGVGINHQFYRFARKRVANRYPKKMGDPANDVNVYISEYSLDSLNQINIPISAIKRIDVYQKESGRSALTYVGGILGGYYGFLIIISLLTSI